MSGGADRRRGGGALAVWLVPAGVLGGAALVLFAAALAVDAWVSGVGWRAFTDFFDADAEMAWNTLGNLAQVVAAILGIAITVVSIVVELAANRYTPRITDLFLRAPANFAVLGFFLVSCLFCVWISIAVHADFIPRVGIATALALLTASLLLLIPYFAYVFRFLEPRRVIERLRDGAMGAMREAAARPEGSAGRRRRVVEEIEHLADIALNAVGHREKAIAMDAVRCLREVAEAHQGVRRGLPDGWFDLGPDLVQNPDFVSMAPEVIAELRRQRSWLEMKILRQFQTAYGEALGHQREIAYMIAIHTRALGEAALRSGDPGLAGLSIKFFNTYLRATVNARDVRTGYNVLNQYRLLAEDALRCGAHDTAVEIARHFGYYGQVAFASGLPFLLETAAYDLCALNEAAFGAGKGPEVREPLLALFLEVDKESEGLHEHEASLRGVRKAQVKLAVSYLAAGEEGPARRIQADMEREPDHRLRSIRDELRAVTARTFWEITDRGVNLDYIAPERRAHLEMFFGWFGERLAERDLGQRREAP